TAYSAMLSPAPPTISTSAPGLPSRNGATVRHASTRLSLALAATVGSTPAGSGTSMWSAYGTRTRSLSAPPQFPPSGPRPNIAGPGTLSQSDVRPALQRAQSPQEIWNGTETTSPARTPSTTSATNSWPSAIGPGSGASPRAMGVSRSQAET